LPDHHESRIVDQQVEPGQFLNERGNFFDLCSYTQIRMEYADFNGMSCLDCRRCVRQRRVRQVNQEQIVPPRRQFVSIGPPQSVNRTCDECQRMSGLHVS